MAEQVLLKNGVEVHGGRLLLKVSRDKLEAFLLPVDLDEPEAPIDLDRLQVELHGQGVVFGLLPDLERREDGALVVARGQAPVNGEDAKILLKVKPATFHPPQAQLDKDRVDFKELHNLVNVTAGRVLAEKVPPTQGRPGKDVFGWEIPAKSGKDRQLRGGPGVRVSEDGATLVAEIDGKFVVADNKPTVMAEHVVLGNVDFSVGNIVFGGASLTIHGEVRPGFSVKCRGDIRIDKGINNAQVVAGGNLEVQRSIIGEEADIVVRGDITADFIENGPRIHCEGSVTAKDYIYQARVQAGGNIRINGDGALVGGSHVAGGSIYVKELGSDAGVPTEVTVGMSPTAVARKEKVEEEFTLWSGRLNEVIKTVSVLQKQKKTGELSPEQLEKLQKYSAAMPKLMDKVDLLNEEAKRLHDELANMVDAGVYIFNRVFPGVVIKIGNGVKGVTAIEREVVAYYDRASGQIHFRKMYDEEKALQQ